MRLAIIIVIGLFLASCLNEGDCLVSATNFMHLKFKKEANNALDSAVYFTHIFVSGTDSVLFKNDTLVSEVLIPVDIRGNSTTFVLQRTSLTDPSILKSDTLQIGYSTQSKVISKVCGAFTYYQNLKIVKTNLKESQIKAFSTSLLKDPTSSGISAYAVNYQIYY